MKKSRKKGFSITQVMAVSVILSFTILQMYRNVTNVIESNQLTLEKREAFNTAEYLYMHLVGADNTDIYNVVESSDVAVYEWDDCRQSSNPIRGSFTNRGFCRGLFDPNLNINYERDQVYLYVYKHDQATFTQIQNTGTYHQVMRDFASNYNDEFYYTAQNHIYGVSVVVEYDDYTKELIYNQVIG